MFASGLTRTLRYSVAIVAIPLLIAFVGSGVAEAGLGAAATPTFPTTVTVGNTGLAASIQLRNDNTTPNTASTVCNVGDALPCPVGELGITLIPSCGLLGLVLGMFSYWWCGSGRVPGLRHGTWRGGYRVCRNDLRGHIDRSGIRAAAFRASTARNPRAVTPTRRHLSDRLHVRCAEGAERRPGPGDGGKPDCSGRRQHPARWRRDHGFWAWHEQWDHR